MRLILVIPILAIAVALPFFDLAATTTALPDIAMELRLGPSSSWVLGTFTVAGAAIQLLVGRLSDIVGRKRLLLGVLAVHFLGTLLTGFAQHGTMIFAGRALIGVGAGAVYVRVSSPTTGGACVHASGSVHR